MKSFKLAIDGPAGSGKSTVSQNLAKKLGWNHIDTGAMFRALTLYLLENNVNWKNEQILIPILSNINISYNHNKIFLNQKDVTLQVKSNIVEQNVPSIAAIPTIRHKLWQLQKTICQTTPFLIMDGRDIGTQVIPNADLKIFLTANIKKRAFRKQKELQQKGQFVTIDELILQFQNRDNQDINRSLAPLKKASNAILLDTSELLLPEVVARIFSLIQSQPQKEN